MSFNRDIDTLQAVSKFNSRFVSSFRYIADICNR